MANYGPRKPRKHKILRVTGGRVAYTNTSKLTAQQIESMIRFVAKHTEMDKVVLHVKASAGTRNDGRCYGYLPEIANTEGLIRREWRSLISMNGHSGHGFLWLLAHEAKHVEQQRRLGLYASRRGWEDAANAFASWIVDQWKAAQA